MLLAHHIRPLLRDHDCVIIPEFGGLVAEFAPARLEAGRQGIRPPAKWVAFNQALTRNDGLLVDAVAHAEHLTIAEARQLVREAVAQLQASLEAAQRAELPGIGVFRRVAGRGLSFEYTGTDNLLPAAFGLPTLPVRAVRAIDARAAREQLPLPALRSGSGGGRRRLRRALPGLAVGLVAVGLVALNLFMGLRTGALPRAWEQQLGRYAWLNAAAPAAPAPAGPGRPSVQQANLGHQTWTDTGVADNAPAPAVLPGAGQPAALAPEAVAGPPTAPAEATETAATLATPAAAAAPTAAVPTAAEASTTGLVPDSKPTVKQLAKAVRLNAPAGAVGAVAPAVVAPGAVATAPVAGAAPAKAATPVGPGYAVTIKGRTGRYYVMGGAFRTLGTALGQRLALARLGHRARVLLPGFGEIYYKVSIDDYPNQATAQREAQRMRTQTRLGTGLWVLQR